MSKRPLDKIPNYRPITTGTTIEEPKSVIEPKGKVKYIRHYTRDGIKIHHIMEYPNDLCKRPDKYINPQLYTGLQKHK